MMKEKKLGKANLVHLRNLYQFFEVLEVAADVVKLLQFTVAVGEPFPVSTQSIRRKT